MSVSRLSFSFVATLLILAELHRGLLRATAAGGLLEEHRPLVVELFQPEGGPPEDVLRRPLVRWILLR